MFGGIYRPVYLEVVPETYIDHTALNAKADGSFLLDVYAKNLKEGDIIEGKVQKLNGENVGKPFTVAANTTADRTDFILPTTEKLLRVLQKTFLIAPNNCQRRLELPHLC